MFGKIRLRKADTLYSLYLRKKRGYKCERCGIYKDKGHGLQVSHFHSRRKESVRFDELNTDVLCIKCHMSFSGVFDYPSRITRNGGGMAIYKQWKLKKLGQREYDLLELRANQTKKKDDAMIILWIKQQEEAGLTAW